MVVPISKANPVPVFFMPFLSGSVGKEPVTKVLEDTPLFTTRSPGMVMATGPKIFAWQDSLCEAANWDAERIFFPFRSWA